MTALRTKTEELGDSRVRLEVEVPTETLEQEVRTAATEIGRDLRVPGFRRGKVPPQVVIQQVGRDAVLDEAVRRGLPAWYEQAVTEAGIATVGDPKVDLRDLPERGSPLAFTVEVAVRPRAELGEYRGIEVGRREPEVSPDEVEAELERVREALASLETVEREAADGDFVVIDFVGRLAPDPAVEDAAAEPFEGGEARGQLIELGAGRLIPGFEEQLRGVRAGERRELKVTFPDDYSAEHLAGREALFEVEVKEVKEKRLPELNDDFALEAGGYDSLDELRAEIEGRLRRREEEAIEGEFREAVVDAAARESKIELPHELVHAKAHEMWHRTARRLSQQGIEPQKYLELTGKTEEQLAHEAEPDAEVALRRESVLAAVVEREGIEASDEEVLDSLRAAAQGEGGGRAPSEKALRRTLKRLRAQGAEDALREDIAMRKAVDLLVEHARAIPVEQAQAREKLWTPGKQEQEAGAGRIWTPGS